MMSHQRTYLPINQPCVLLAADNFVILVSLCGFKVRFVPTTFQSQLAGVRYSGFHSPCPLVYLFSPTTRESAWGYLEGLSPLDGCFSQFQFLRLNSGHSPRR
jgi:hypothetical protein